LYPLSLYVSLREQQIETTIGGTEMKKQLITSICTLVLSLLGAFGLNQNYVNSNADYVATDSVEAIQNIENNQSLNGDNQTTVAEADADAAEVTDTDKVITDNKNTDTDKINENVQNNNTTAVNKVSNGGSTAAKTDSKPQTSNAAGKQTNVTTQTQVQPTPASKVNSVNSNNCRVVNGQVYYGNVNLSNCNSVGDIVKVLNSNGYNVSTGNLQNAESLKNILSIINKNDTNTTAPSNKPSNTGSVKTPATPAPSNTQTSKPAPSATPAPATSTNSSQSSYASEVLRLVNVERAKAGLPALTTNSTLTSAANKRAEEIKQYFSHTRPNGSSAFTVLGEYGISYRTAGENIAYGQKTPQEVVDGWMNSPGHRANILNANFGKIGIGVYQSGGVYYWTQLFTD